MNTNNKNKRNAAARKIQAAWRQSNLRPVIGNNRRPVTNIITMNPIPMKYAITIDKQVYDARSLVKWFNQRLGNSVSLPHSRRELKISNNIIRNVYLKAGKNIANRPTTRMTAIPMMNMNNGPNTYWG
jgi:hypothetical protein